MHFSPPFGIGDCSAQMVRDNLGRQLSIGDIGRSVLNSLRSAETYVDGLISTYSRLLRSNVCTALSASDHYVVYDCCEIGLSPLKPGVNKACQEIDGARPVRKLHMNVYYQLPQHMRLQ